MNWQVDDGPAPSLLAPPAAAASLDEAHAAIELWEFYKRRKLDPSQRLAVEVMMATRDDGLWAASSTGEEKPRQCGKGEEIEVVELWGLTQRAERILHTIHDAVLLATETQSRMLSLLEGHPDLSRLTLRPWRGTGQQMIPMRNGGRIWYRTRTGSGGRGIDDVDRIVVDEAQHAELEHLAAVTPTQSVSVNPQLNALGTGGLEGKSGWWWSQRKLAKHPPADFGWIGYSAQPWELDERGAVVLGDVDPLDRSLWRRCHTGLVAGRTSQSFLERELRTLGAEKFAQEYLCVWAPPPPDLDAFAVDPDVWAALVDTRSSIASQRCIALDVTPARTRAAFAAAGRRSDGRLHVEPFDCRAGTGWVLDRAVELHAKWRLPIRVQKRSPAASFVTEMRERGVAVTEVSAEDHAAAVGQFLDACRNDQLRHLGNSDLTGALAGAVLQPSGDVELWGRRHSKVDISPLVAVTIALGGVPAVGRRNREFLLPQEGESNEAVRSPDGGQPVAGRV